MSVVSDTRLFRTQAFINGEWVDPVTPQRLEVINPATEQPFATISMGSAADVEKAVAAASAAFETFSQTTVAERVELLGAILAEYTKRYDEIAAAIGQAIIGFPQNSRTFLRGMRLLPPRAGMMATFMQRWPRPVRRPRGPARPRSASGTSAG